MMYCKTRALRLTFEQNKGFVRVLFFLWKGGQFFSVIIPCPLIESWQLGSSFRNKRTHQPIKRPLSKLTSALFLIDVIIKMFIIFAIKVHTLHSSIWNAERYTQRGAAKIYNEKDKWHSLWYCARKFKWFLINSMQVCSVIIFLIFCVILYPDLATILHILTFFVGFGIRDMIVLHQRLYF